MDDKKRQAAAVSAVMAYIKKEEDERRIAPLSADVFTASNIWGISGRQAQMQLRTMMQLKGFHGAKLR
jgi:hypothetical protein